MTDAFKSRESHSVISTRRRMPFVFRGNQPASPTDNMYLTDTIQPDCPVIPYPTDIGIHHDLYIIGGVSEGGSNKFLNDVIRYFKKSKNIIKRDLLEKTPFKCNDILLIQHLVNDIKPQHIVALYQKYNFRIIINIHDFYYLSETLAVTDNIPHNMYLSNNIRINIHVTALFNAAEVIIHPSTFTADRYRPHFPTANHMVSPHIDYLTLDSVLAIPELTNNTINIGVMHGFSICKGKEYIEYLQQKFKTYAKYNIKFLIVNQTIPSYKENEFFEFLVKYNIHCLTALNKWGETYCYSLSKFLKSGLPIIYNSIGAFRERIPDKPHFIRVFDSEVGFNAIDKQLLESRFRKLLDFVISNNKPIARESFDTALDLPLLYRQLFCTYAKLDPLNVENIVLLSSSIVTSTIPLSYTPTRSAYSSKERFYQTLKNINIIRYKIPNSAIIIIDPTDLSAEWKEYLSAVVDIYVDATTDVSIKILADTCPNKGVAECTQILKGLDYIAEYKNAKNIFKLSGRYYLSKSFDYTTFDSNKVCFKTVPPSSVFFEKVPACYTFLYKVPVVYVNKLKIALITTIIKGLDSMASIETLLPYAFDKSIVDYDAILGVSGFIGPNKHFLDDVR